MKNVILTNPSVVHVDDVSSSRYYGIIGDFGFKGFIARVEIDKKVRFVAFHCCGLTLGHLQLHIAPTLKELVTNLLKIEYKVIEFYSFNEMALWFAKYFPLQKTKFHETGKHETVVMGKSSKYRL